jgi:CcmD family protein
VKDFQFLFTAWIAVWAVFFLYEATVARRVSKLRQEIDRLKQQLRES